MAEIVTHINQGQKYRIVIERAASTKGIDGFKVEANGDDISQVGLDIEKLYTYAQQLTSPKTIQIEGGK